MTHGASDANGIGRSSISGEIVLGTHACPGLSVLAVKSRLLRRGSLLNRRSSCRTGEGYIHTAKKGLKAPAGTLHWENGSRFPLIATIRSQRHSQRPVPPWRKALHYRAVPRQSSGFLNRCRQLSLQEGLCVRHGLPPRQRLRPIAHHCTCTSTHTRTQRGVPNRDAHGGDGQW